MRGDVRGPWIAVLLVLGAPDLDQGVYDLTDCDTEGRFETTLHLVPEQNALLRVQQEGKVTFQAKLTDIAKPLPGNRWDVELRLRAQ